MQHRKYVGGDFERIGHWQYKYITSYTDISPQTKFLDIACGCFRLGKLMIPYLDNNCYFGIDSNHEIVDAGLEFELNDINKDFNVSVNSNFNFSFCNGYDIAWANSLLSHLTLHDIKTLFTNLKSISNEENTFYFTYFDKERTPGRHRGNSDTSDARKDFYYDWLDIKDTLVDVGWNCIKTPVQNHPRHQTVVCAKIT